MYDDPASFVRRDDGIWCRRDVRGRLYLVNRIGQRCAKPKTFEKIVRSLQRSETPCRNEPPCLVEGDDEGRASAVVDRSS